MKIPNLWSIAFITHLFKRELEKGHLIIEQ